MRRLVAMLVCAVIAVLAPASASAAKPCEGADGALEAIGLKASRGATLCLLNAERTTRGIVALRTSARLTRAAQKHTDNMIARGYFAHGDFCARITSTGWGRHRRSYTVGENLAFGSGDGATPRAIVAAWMHSPGHRHNILERRFRVIGIGVAAGTPAGAAGATYSTDFGS